MGVAKIETSTLDDYQINSYFSGPKFMRSILRSHKAEYEL